MFIRNAFLGIASFSLTPTNSFAAAAAPDEEARLLGLLQSYVGAERGVVAVAPDGVVVAALQGQPERTGQLVNGVDMMSMMGGQYR